MKQKLKTFFRKYWRSIIVLGFSVFFFVSASAFNFYTQDETFVKWLSPDETANYIFTKLYAQTGNLTIRETNNPFVSSIIHPRSFRVDGEYLKPMSFLGIILVYGKIASVIGVESIPYLTPFFGAVGIFFFYLLIKELFGKRNGLISAALLTVFPPYFYYSSRSMFHNVLMVVFLIIAFYFAVIMVKRRSKDLETPAVSRILRNFIYPALAGSFFGLAIITRTSELLWLAPLLLLLWLFNIRRIGLIKLLMLLSFLGLAILPSAYWNQVLYGAPLNTGYPEMNTSIAKLTETSSALVGNTITNAGGVKFSAQKELFEKLKNTIFYFGFDQYKSMKMFYFYFYKMFAWLFWTAILGLLFWLIYFRDIKKGQVYFLVGLSLVSVILLFYYGSWDFHDNPDPKQKTIGNSYTRYWLPIYLGAIPFASLLFIRLTQFFRNRFAVNGTRILIIAAIYAFSIQFILFGSDEGLVSSAYKQKSSRIEFEQVMKLTEKNGVIISQYHDKLFFPQRKVILGLFNDENMNREYSKLAARLPLYYYNFTFNQKDLDYLNRTKLARSNLKIKKIKTVNKDFTLYQLENRK